MKLAWRSFPVGKILLRVVNFDANPGVDSVCSAVRCAAEFAGNASPSVSTTDFRRKRRRFPVGHFPGRISAVKFNVQMITSFPVGRDRGVPVR